MGRWQQKGYRLNEIVPQDACGVLVNAHIGGDVDGVILNHRSSRAAPLSGEKFAQLCKPRETPVAFFSIEPVVGG